LVTVSGIYNGQASVNFLSQYLSDGSVGGTIIGDVTGSKNSTEIALDDVAQTIKLDAINNVEITNANLKIDGVQYSWMNSQGAAGTVLTNDGSGNLSWALPNGGWSLAGNTGTTPGTNFIGTTDNQDFVVKTNMQKQYECLPMEI
jgi:hypothetical protein